MGWDCDFGASNCTGKLEYNVLHQLRMALRERCIVLEAYSPPRGYTDAVEWSSGNYYYPHDVVEHNGVQYTAQIGKYDNTNKDPEVETDYWVTTASEGEPVLHRDGKLTSSWFTQFVATRDQAIVCYYNHTAFSQYMEPGDLHMWTLVDIGATSDVPLSQVSIGAWAAEQYRILNLLRSVPVDPAPGNDFQQKYGDSVSVVSDPLDPSRATWAKAKADFDGNSWAPYTGLINPYYAYGYHLVWYDEFGVPFLWEDSYHVEGLYGHETFTVPALKVPCFIYAIYYLEAPGDGLSGLNYGVFQPIGEWVSPGQHWLMQSDTLTIGETTFHVKEFSQAEAEGHSFIDPDSDPTWNATACMPQRRATMAYYMFEYRTW